MRGRLRRNPQARLKRAKSEAWNRLRDHPSGDAEERIAWGPAEIAGGVEWVVQTPLGNIDGILFWRRERPCGKARETSRGITDNIALKPRTRRASSSVHGKSPAMMRGASLLETYASGHGNAPEAFASGAGSCLVAGAGFEPAAFRL